MTAEERAELAHSVRAAIERSGAARARRAARDGVAEPIPGPWSALRDQIGVAGLLIPERFGGLGAGVREMQTVAEELGRELVPTPLLGSAVVAVAALLTTGDDRACGRLLPDIASGARIATVAWTGEGGGWAPDAVAVCADADHRLTGKAHYVLDASAADVLLVAARRSDGIGLYQVDSNAPGVRRYVTATMDPTRRLGTVNLDGVLGDAAGSTVDLRAVRDVACAVLAAEQVGAAARALERTVEYSLSRMQFGRVIGSFQALKHRMADMYVRVEAARSAAYVAGDAIDAEDPGASTAVATAKVTCSRALKAVAAEMIQLHGGIGITWEHDAHLYFKRAHGDSLLFGAAGRHLARRQLTHS